MLNRCLLTLAVLLLPLSTEAQRRPGGRRSSSVSGEATYADAVFRGATYAWPEANSCVASPGWNPMPASSGGPNADIPLSAVNQTYTCDVSTAPSGDNAPFGNKAGLIAAGIGTASVNDAWSSEGAACWIDATPTGFAAIADGANFAIGWIFRPTTTAGTKVIFYWSTGAAEYIQIEMGTAVTVRFREGASGNQTITWSPALNVEHLMHVVFIGDHNGDGGNPGVYLYADGGLAESTGGTLTNGAEAAVNMGEFGAPASISLGCNGSELNMWTGEILRIGMWVGADFTAKFGANAAAHLAEHRADCEVTGICSTDDTVMIVLGGQSLATGFNSYAGSAVTITSNVARATVMSNHGISVGDILSTTSMNPNVTGVAVTAVGSNYVEYPLVGANGLIADPTGTITISASTRVQAYNDREGRNNGTLPLLVEGTAGASNAYESPLTSIATGLHTLRTGEQYVAFERAITNTSICALNEDTGDGTDTTTNYDNLEVWGNDLDDRVGSLGSQIEAVGVWINNEGGTGGVDYTRQNWAEYFVALQSDLDEDFRAITGQSIEVPLCFTQNSNWTSNSLTVGTIANETLDAHELLLNGNRGALTGAFYPYYFSDGTHLTVDASKRIGLNQIARCVDATRATLKAEPGASWWSPTRPTDITCSGTTVTVTIHAPTPPLVLDTTTVTDPGDSGFEYSDTDASANPTIDAVDCSASCVGNTCFCVLTFSSSPCSLLGAQVAYAWTGVSGQAAGPATGARGNVRDSADTDADANWLVAFKRPITNRTFVDDYAWDFDGLLEECSAADDANWESTAASGQVIDGLLIDAWLTVDTGATNDKNVISKGNNATHNWSMLVENCADPDGGGPLLAGFSLRVGVVGVANFVQFANDACASPYADCSYTGHTNCLPTSPADGSADQWVHAVVSLDLSRGTMATDEVVVATTIATARIPAGVPSYIAVGQTVVTTALTACGNVNTPILSIPDSTHITFSVPTCPDGTLADSVGVATVNDAKIRAWVATCTAATPPVCGTLTEVQGLINGSMGTAFSANTQPLRIGGFGSGVSGTYYLAGRLGETSIAYASDITAGGVKQPFTTSWVRECLESTTTHKPVDHVLKSWHVFLDADSGEYKSCNVAERRWWGRHGDDDSGVTFRNHAWLNTGTTPPAMTCSNNTGTDRVLASID